MTRIKTSQSIQKRLREELDIDIRVFKPGMYIYIVWPHDDSGDLSLKEIKLMKTRQITGNGSSLLTEFNGNETVKTWELAVKEIKCITKNLQNKYSPDINFIAQAATVTIS